MFLLNGRNPISGASPEQEGFAGGEGRGHDLGKPFVPREGSWKMMGNRFAEPGPAPHFLVDLDDGGPASGVLFPMGSRRRCQGEIRGIEFDLSPLVPLV